MPRTGRPPLPDEERLGEKRTFGFRLAPHEEDELCRRAIASRQSLNLYVRDVLRRHLGVFVVKS